jgi:hypothetical protein
LKHFQEQHKIGKKQKDEFEDSDAEDRPQILKMTSSIMNIKEEHEM